MRDDDAAMKLGIKMSLKEAAKKQYKPLDGLFADSESDALATDGGDSSSKYLSDGYPSSEDDETTQEMFDGDSSPGPGLGL